MNISTRISTLRKKKGLSREELAERLNISKFTLRNYEQGAHTPVSYTHLDVYKRQ